MEALEACIDTSVLLRSVGSAYSPEHGELSILTYGAHVPRHVQQQEFPWAYPL